MTDSVGKERWYGTLNKKRRENENRNEWLVTRRHQTPVSSFRAKREIFVIRGQKLTLSIHVPRISPFSSSVFHTASALSAPSGHLPLEGKALVRGGGILVSLPSPWGKRILNFSLLPLEGGAPKGRRLALAVG